jgi:hypothetical protein
MKHKLNVLFFLLPLLILFSLNLALDQTKTISLLEKRAIRSRPVFSVKIFFSGQFSRDYDDYYADNFVFRDLLVEVGSAIKGLKGFQGDDGAILLAQKGNNMSGNLVGARPVSQEMPSADIKKGAAGPDGPAVIDQSTPAGGGVTATEKRGSPGGQTTAAPQEEVTEGLHVANVSDTYLVLRDRALLLYKYNPASAGAYAKAVNRLRASIDPKIRMYNLLVPSQIEFLGTGKYRGLSDSQKQALSQVNRLLNKTVTPVDAYGALHAHKDEYVYLRTDHHWTAVGAYYVYREFMKTVGEEPVALGKYRKEELSGYLGTAYAATLKSSLKRYPDTIELYIPFTPYDYTVYTTSDVALTRDVVGNASVNNRIPDYSVFLGGDFPWGVIKTNVKNKKHILVIKDSYANAFIPFLLPHYEEIYFIDPRHFKTNLLKFIKDKNINDVLMLNGSFVTTYSGISDLLTEIMTK